MRYGYLMEFSFRREDVERFTMGDCYILARAIHLLTGWDIACFSYMSNPDNDTWGAAHAFCVRPDGKCIDIEGVHAPDEFIEKWEAQSIKTWPSWRKMSRKWGGYDFSKYSYERAKVIAPKVVELASVA